MSLGGARFHDCCVEADGFRIRCLSFQAADFLWPKVLGAASLPIGINPLTTIQCVAAGWVSGFEIRLMPPIASRLAPTNPASS